MNGLVVVYLLHAIECSAVKKDETVDTHNNLDESSGNYIVRGKTCIKKLQELILKSYKWKERATKKRWF